MAPRSRKSASSLCSRRRSSSWLYRYSHGQLWISLAGENLGDSIIGFAVCSRAQNGGSTFCPLWRYVTKTHTLPSGTHGLLARWIKRRACDVGEAKEGLENELWRRWSNARVWRMSCDVGKATEGLENELWRRWNIGKVGEWAYTVMKITDTICPILVTWLTLFYSFLCQTSVVLITGSKKAVMAITYSKNLKLNIESYFHEFTAIVFVK